MNRSLKFLRFSPEIRSSYIERFESGPSSDTFYSRATYIDDVMLSKYPQYKKVGQAALVKILIQGRYDVVELPEPLWLRQWPSTLLLLIAAKVGGWLARRQVSLVTYAIENAEPSRLFYWLPSIAPNWMREKILWLAVVPGVMLFTRIAFGTSGSADTYYRACPSFLRNKLTEISRVFLPLPERLWDHDQPKDGFVFLGSFEARKGVDQLLSAWKVFSAGMPTARLTMIGKGPLETEVLARAKADGFAVRSHLLRSEIHEELGRAKVVVLLSQPEGNWREQIGLPILEGIAHGCRVVTTDQTGIAEWLMNHGHIVIPYGSCIEGIVEALDTANKEIFVPPADSWSTPNGRAIAAQWMLGD